MKFTLSWLKDHLETECNLHEISDKLTNLGLEVEKIVSSDDCFIISRIEDVKPHPNADKLSVCVVDNGEEILQIVCGASNVRPNINVVLAKIGTTIPVNGMVVKKSKIRGVTSNGMLCSEFELGLGKNCAGILELDEGAQVGERFLKNEEVIEIAITPNRGDCLGVRGIARDLAAVGCGRLKPLKEVKIEFYGHESPIKVGIDDVTACNCFIGCYIENVKSISSPDWLQSRLKSVGLEPISALVDITNYCMLSFNRPMHVYDADKLTGKLSVRCANKGEKLQALNNKEYELDDGIAVIADDNEVQALAGIIGGKNSGCSMKTANVFLEVASFDAIKIGMNSRKLGLATDSSYRFERSLDSDFTIEGAKIAIDLIMSLCGGKPYKLTIVGDNKKEVQKIPFDMEKIKKIAGFKIDEQSAIDILQDLGFTLERKEISVPTWRNDIGAIADIAEEILRVKGYNSIPLKPLPDIMHKRNFDILSLHRDVLINSGMYEVITWSFMDSKKAILQNGLIKHELIKIKNPMSENLDVMRPSIIPNLLDVMANNFARGETSIAIFEIGAVYGGEAKEKQMIAGLRAGFSGKRNIYAPQRRYDIFDVKADVLQILEQYNITSPQLAREAPGYYHPGRSGTFKLGKVVLAYFGELLEHYNVNRVNIFEVFIERVFLVKKKNKSKKVSIYQAVNRDFAFVVKKEVSVKDIVQAINESEKNLIKEIEVFDVYEGKDIGEKNKSVAIAVKMQANDRTLSESDISCVHSAIIDHVGRKTGGILRRDYEI